MKDELERLRDPVITREHLIGMDFMLRLLWTSPRMHKPQQEIILEQTEAIRERIKEIDAEAQGTFRERLR